MEKDPFITRSQQTLPCSSRSSSRHDAPKTALATTCTDEFEYPPEATMRRRRSNAPSPEPEEQKHQQMQESRVGGRSWTSRDRQSRSRISLRDRGLGMGQIHLNEPRRRPRRSCNVAGIRWRRRVGVEPSRRARGAGTRGTATPVGVIGGSAGRVVVSVRDRAAAEMIWTILQLRASVWCREPIGTRNDSTLHAL
ncbi:hypothetical protein ACKVV1_011084 [Pyricularia oryzae]